MNAISRMDGKKIVLGVCGGIAAYKACELTSRLTQNGAQVHVVLTENATRFVAPLTFQALTHQPVHSSLWPQTTDGESGVYTAMAHIALADEADAVLIAPATANTLAKLAAGFADDLLSTLVLATRAPVIVCPAMNPRMLSHAATQRTLRVLSDELGYEIVAPESGRMACEHVGAGRLPATEIILSHLQNTLFPSRDLTGLRVLITAGPTREPLDPVRFLTNKSSGKMGYALAETAAARGANVLLVSGPTQLASPRGVQKIDVETTQQMFEAALHNAPSCDIIVAAAAPADYRAAQVATQKMKKLSTQDELVLHLQTTPDIVAHIAAQKKPSQIVIGFAAETGSATDEARRKLQAKNLDAIAFNDVTQSGAGFDVDTNKIVWISADAEYSWPLMSKREVAARIWDEAKKLHDAKAQNAEAHAPKIDDA